MRLRKNSIKFLVVAGIGFTAALSMIAIAQPPRNGGERGPGGPGGGGSNAATTLQAFVAKWLTMDTNSDGQLSAEELKDERLRNLFKTSDKNSDGILDREEMKLLFETSSASRSQSGGPGAPGGRPPRGR